MEQEEIIEGNKLIAEFMCLSNSGYGWGDACWLPGNYVCLELEYNISWDWLMPVVEKIEAIKGCKVFTNQAGCEILSFGKTISRHYASTKSEATWLAVVDFIQWYNKQPTDKRSVATAEK